MYAGMRAQSRTHKPKDLHTRHLKVYTCTCTYACPPTTACKMWCAYSQVCVCSVHVAYPEYATDLQMLRATAGASIWPLQST